MRPSQARCIASGLLKKTSVTSASPSRCIRVLAPGARTPIRPRAFLRMGRRGSLASHNTTAHLRDAASRAPTISLVRISRTGPQLLVHVAQQHPPDTHFPLPRLYAASTTNPSSSHQATAAAAAVPKRPPAARPPLALHPIRAPPVRLPSHPSLVQLAKTPVHTPTYPEPAASSCQPAQL